MDNSSNHNPPMEDSSSKNKLCIKIKMPTTAAATTEAQGDGGSGGGDDFQQLKPGQLGYRVCEFCGKKFDNGKAWGGHKRHHLKILKNNSKRNQEVKTNIQKHKNDGGVVEDGGSKIVGRCNVIKAGDVRMSSDGKPTCCLCGEVFDSYHSLFGHMRFHPDRDWKGINRPSSSSGIDQIYSASVSTAKENSDNSIDLLSSLSGWSRRDKRGRSCLSDLIPQAAQSLLTLARDITTQESAGHQQEGSGSATKSFRRVLESDKKLGFDSNQNYGLLVNHKNKKMKLENEEVDGNDGVVADEIPESEAEEEEEDDDDDQVRSPMENIFQCDICEKTYPTGQALGGHKRSHWKAPAKGLPNEDANHSSASNFAFNTPSSCGKPEGIQATHGMLNIDLNKPYVMQEDGEESFSDD
ncbi:hypothetical protein JCGZ_11077 [Jatropha curcas]|uniref:C2H2-type domain-containing protein n=1 Tax=Jatropha curcas TaxID=180498 RepID=A0A067KEH3_JATCU|nr:zinc finger protein ZAT9 [Jatropha curcas]KDP34527.1 hypothetical protein JCGZ_11077 [Jatropha curcas]